MGNLGLIPSWQFSADAAVNPMINDHVTMPEGMYQAGVYSKQPVWGRDGTGLGGVTMGNGQFNCLSCAGTRMNSKGVGLGYVQTDEGGPPVGVPYGFVSPRPLGPLKDMPLSGLGIFETESFIWTHRKALILGGLGIVGAAALVLASSILR